MNEEWITCLPTQAHAHIVAHAKSDYPNECCGLLVGKINERHFYISQVVPTENAEAERAGDRFTIEPEAIARTDSTAREQGLDLIGIYHSHPDIARPNADPSALVAPSATDLEFAQWWEGMVWIIIGVIGSNRTHTEAFVPADKCFQNAKLFIPIEGIGLPGQGAICHQWDNTIDLCGEPNPFVLLGVKKQLKTMGPGQLLQVILDYEPALDELTEGLPRLGHTVLTVRRASDDAWELLARKAR